MVSFWPWKGADSSPASFEKALSTLSTKISKTSSKLDSLKQRSRRFSALWTLYSVFAYLLYTIILGLVVGWRKWGPAEYAAVVGGPLIIYLVRLCLITYYNYRTSNIQSHLDELQTQRDATIEKLKAATRYNTTQELLKKYGSTPTPGAKSVGVSERKVTPKQEGVSKGSRTSFIPPPTANIHGRDGITLLQTSSQHSSPQARSFPQQSSFTSGLSSPPKSMSPEDTSEEFAPNAFSASLQYAQTNEGSRWYDRLIDVLLGEDETRAGARLALICNSCRLVNGQAPPGVKRLEDLGKWRCGGCGAMNGKEMDAKKIIASLKEQAPREARHTERENGGGRTSKNTNTNDGATSASTSELHDSDVTQYSTEDSAEDGAREEMTDTKKCVSKPGGEPDIPRRRSTRPTKGKRR